MPHKFGHWRPQPLEKMAHVPMGIQRLGTPVLDYDFLPGLYVISYMAMSTRSCPKKLLQLCCDMHVLICHVCDHSNTAACKYVDIYPVISKDTLEVSYCLATAFDRAVCNS